MSVVAPPAMRGGAGVAPSVPRVRGRLAPEAMFPAGRPGYRVRIETLRTGERVRIVECGPAGGDPVVFFPGWGCPVWDFHRMIPAVADAGFRSIAVDLRGHGLSDMPEESSLYTTDAMVAHAIDILDASALPHVVLIGHSMGGALAMHVALRAPERVRALALVSPIGFGIARLPEIGRALSPRWMIPVARALLRRLVVATGLRLLCRDRSLVTPESVDEYWASSQFDGFVPAMRWLLHGFRWNRFTAEELSAVGIPGILVRGTRDPIVKRGRNPQPLPNLWRELVVEGAGHLPHDESPDLVHREIVALLRATGSPSVDSPEFR
jgi:pyruvate dehydrogenase E2 component (dihydrolipoamide acetyltransferase)